MGAKYAFFPYLRSGVGNQITEVDGTVSSPAKARPTVNIKIVVNKGDNVSSSLNILGPGDVRNINPKNIVKVEPVDGYQEYEPNFFPYIEFYDEYFPWKLTPAKPKDSAKQRLTPWVFLAVLKTPLDGITGEYSNIDATSDSLTGIQVKSNLLPATSDLWAWSHVQVNGDMGDLTNLNGSLTNVKGVQGNNPDIVIARAISSRLLEPETHYTAFLLPTYEVGRLSGLGLDRPTDVDVKKFAWDPTSSSEEKIHPVYYRWSFKTGSSGDFENLARKLQARTLDSKIGKRPMDMAPALDTLINTNAITKAKADTINNLSVEGALAPKSFNHTVWSSDGRTALRKVINFGEDLKKVKPSTFDINHPYFDDSSLKNDPVVLPPFYGRYHSGIAKLSATGGWMVEINDDPQYRLAAGIGTQVIQENQEDFMAYAWQQIGDVIEANKKIMQAELAKALNDAIYNKHISALSSGEGFLNMTSSVQSKVEQLPGESIQKHIKDTLLPQATQTSSFRKVIRPRGFVAKSINKNIGVTGTSAVTGGFQAKILTNLNDPTKAEVKIAKPKLIPTIALDLAVVNSALSLVASGSATLEDKQKNVFSSLKPVATELPPVPPQPTSISLAVSNLLAGLSPDNTMANQTNCNIDVPEPTIPFQPDVLKPVLGYPKFPYAMFDYLKRISPDLIIPNIELLPDNTISLLQTNQKFIESFLIGLNQEFGKELLWREYPTDQRGTYFRNFWSTKDDLLLNYKTDEEKTEAAADIKPIDKWGNNSVLGSHKTQLDATTMENFGQTDNKIVLVIRGELLRKFPNTTIYAQKAKWYKQGESGEDKTKPKELVPFTEADIQNTAIVRFPKFKSKVEPDVVLIGFDLGMNESKGSTTDAGWFIVMKERSGETRFGLDINVGAVKDIHQWSDLTFSHFDLTNKNHLELASIDTNNVHITGDPIKWGYDSANQANILYQPPVMMAIHANKLLTGL